MAESHQPAAGARTASTCSAATARGTHAFKIADYSLHKGLGSRKFIRSAVFAVGGYDWCVRYYPTGPDGDGELAGYLELLTKNAKVRALFQFVLIDHVNASQSLVFSLDQPCVFNSVEAGQSVLGGGLKIPSNLENSPFLRDNCLVLECDVTVLNEPQVVPVVAPKIQVPPSNVLSNLAQLLETGEDADVTYEVKGEVFPAHKFILAMQSPVFKAELYGPMRVATSGAPQSKTVEDMEPDVFKGLLTYIYTDALPFMGDLEAGDREELVKHLLVAADRYGIERMKLMCENILCESLDVERVATTLALADQHHCSSLKDACIEFMNSSGRMDDVVATQGYMDLKTSCPAMLIDVLERANKCRKI